MPTDGQGTKWRRNIAENFNRLSRVHQRYRRQTDRRQTDDRQTDGRWHIANMNLSSRSLIKCCTVTFRIRITRNNNADTDLVTNWCQHTDRERQSSAENRHRKSAKTVQNNTLVNFTYQICQQCIYLHNYHWTYVYLKIDDVTGVTGWGGRQTTPGDTLPGGDTRRKKILWANLQRIVDKRGRTGKKGAGYSHKKRCSFSLFSVKNAKTVQLWV